MAANIIQKQFTSTKYKIQNTMIYYLVLFNLIANQFVLVFSIWLLHSDSTYRKIKSYTMSRLEAHAYAFIDFDKMFFFE